MNDAAPLDKKTEPVLRGCGQKVKGLNNKGVSVEEEIIQLPLDHDHTPTLPHHWTTHYTRITSLIHLTPFLSNHHPSRTTLALQVGDRMETIDRTAVEGELD